jgi:ribosomal 30S subunit maturation factor RimM
MDLFAVGEIVKTRGLRGCLKVLCYVETNNTFAELEFVYIEISSGQKKSFCPQKN